MEFKKVGVVGGGIMGAGIIQVLLNAGVEVDFKELDQDLVEQTLGKVEKIFRSAKLKGLISENVIRRNMASVRGFTNCDPFRDVSLVIEAVPERLEIKREVFEELDRICGPEAILASNTSSLSISQLCGFTQRPERVIGMHWFNPVHIMKLVEIVPGLETSQKTIDALFQLCIRLDKVPIGVKECAGFLVNRLLGIYVNEALFMVEEGQAPQAVDQAAEDMGIPMGPIMLGDMVGWDTIYRANMTLYQEYGSRFGMPSLLAEVYEAGRWGAKAGEGFYKYEGGRVVHEKGYLVEHQEQLSSRLLSVMINEGIRCLDENVASIEDIDTAMKVGAGMPKGPLKWADEIGLDQLLNQLEELRGSYGERFLPSPLLKTKVAARHLGKKKGSGFYRY